MRRQRRDGNSHLGKVAKVYGDFKVESGIAAGNESRLRPGGKVLSREVASNPFPALVEEVSSFVTEQASALWRRGGQKRR